MNEAFRAGILASPEHVGTPELCNNPVIARQLLCCGRLLTFTSTTYSHSVHVDQLRVSVPSAKRSISLRVGLRLSMLLGT